MSDDARDDRLIARERFRNIATSHQVGTTNRAIGAFGLLACEFLDWLTGPEPAPEETTEETDDDRL